MINRRVSLLETKKINFSATCKPGFYFRVLTGKFVSIFRGDRLSHSVRLHTRSHMACLDFTMA